MLDQTLSRIRRNHGLEHATIHVLSSRHKDLVAQGNSDHRGFSLNIYSAVSDEDVARAVHDAHRRMKGGETSLAVHPNCGTVLLTTAAMAATAAQLVFGLEQLRQRRSAFNPAVVANALPTAIAAVVMTLIVSKPVGIALQARYTVEGNLGDLEVTSVKRSASSPITRFFHLLLAPGRETEPRAYRVTTHG